jgi:hypothetical protein
MAGRGPAPKDDKVRRNLPPKADVATSACWSGDVPALPEGLMPASEQAWATWFAAWFSAHWTIDDLPGLRTLVRLYDQVERGEFQRCAELRMTMDTYGITPKGQQDRRWKKPAEPEAPKVGSTPTGGKYSHLKAV